jgi:hypothetical protein
MRCAVRCVCLCTRRVRLVREEGRVQLVREGWAILALMR